MATLYLVALALVNTAGYKDGMSMTDAQMYNAGTHTCASAALWLERLTRLAQQTLGLTVDGKLGPDTMRAVAHWETGSVDHLADPYKRREAFLAAATSQVGKPYIWGAEADPEDLDPRAFDCSELVEWAARQAGVSCPDGSWRQWQACHLLAVPDAIQCPGALLFRFEGYPSEENRPAQAHVAISLGTGFTVEAKSRRDGVVICRATGRGWTHAGILPGLKVVA